MGFLYSLMDVQDISRLTPKLLVLPNERMCLSSDEV